MRVHILAEREGPYLDRVSRGEGRSVSLPFVYLMLPGQRAYRAKNGGGDYPCYGAPGEILAWCLNHQPSHKDRELTRF